MQTVLYARVSTADQTAAHQKTQAQAAGFAVDQVITDEGVSGVSVPFAERPQAKRLFDILRSGDVLVVRWVDRLGRDYADVTDTIRTLMRKGVIVKTVINGMTFDGATADPIQQAVRDALIGFMAATAQAQAEATKAAQKAGIAHALAQPGADQKYRGKKPSYNRDKFKEVLALLGSTSPNISAIANQTSLTRQTVLRIKADPVAAEAALLRWGI